jgi:hypothetical protein
MIEGGVGPKKIDGAQSSINKWFIPPKEINN